MQHSEKDLPLLRFCKLIRDLDACSYSLLAPICTLVSYTDAYARSKRKRTIPPTLCFCRIILAGDIEQDTAACSCFPDSPRRQRGCGARQSLKCRRVGRQPTPAAISPSGRTRQWLTAAPCTPVPAAFTSCAISWAVSCQAAPQLSGFPFETMDYWSARPRVVD